MRTITIKYNPGATDEYGDDRGGLVEEWGTNSRTGGVFTRKRDGTWQQHLGTSQTPWFRDPAHLRRFIRSTYNVANARIVDHQGW